jgi:3-dehydroquinate dehydratase type I
MGEMKIFVPATGPDMPTALKDIEKANGMKHVYGIEERYDMIKDPNLELLMTLAGKPVIFTNMMEKEGGRFKGDRKEWNAVCRQALKFEPFAVSVGSDYYAQFLVDVYEGDPHSRWSFPAKTNVIWTYHNFKETPEDLAQIYEEGANANPTPYIVKLATRANSYSDALRMMELVDSVRKKGKRIIGLPMGEFGVWARVVGCALGNELTFAALSPEKVSGPGQPTVEELVAAAANMQIPVLGTPDKTPKTAMVSVLITKHERDIAPYLQSLGFAENPSSSYPKPDYEVVGGYLAFLMSRRENTTGGMPYEFKQPHLGALDLSSCLESGDMAFFFGKAPDDRLTIHFVGKDSTLPERLGEITTKLAAEFDTGNFVGDLGTALAYWPPRKSSAE